jgi:hypothetical protein
MIGNKDWDIDGDNWIGVPFEKLGDKSYWDTAAIGIAAGLIGIDHQLLSNSLEDVLGKERARENHRILEASRAWLDEQHVSTETLESVSDAPTRWMMNGHEAVALGAISAGLRFCDFYPMSPSTSVAQTLINCADQMVRSWNRQRMKSLRSTWPLGRPMQGYPVWCRLPEAGLLSCPKP